MRVVIQRVSTSKVLISHEVVGEIGLGFTILLGVESEDNSDDIEWLVNKITNLRIFSDQEGKMNLSLTDVEGEVLVISQFTLYASCKKGNRPSFIKSAKPNISEPLYLQFIELLQQRVDKKVQSGEFGADMQVEIVNDGPVTILLDSKNRE